MKKRILFVDDDEFALKGLDRSLRSMRDEWEMEFVGSGNQALNRMAEAHFDVIISDMRMPGMNGAELLNEVMKRHPKTVRLILSGYADHDLILRCIGSTHQYLAKPCDAKTLRMTVQRAAHLEESLKSESLRLLVNRCSVLPSLPALYSEIIEVLQDPDAGVEEIGAIIVKDVAMTAKILKLVNSAFFGLGNEIANPSEAVAYLGTDTIKSLILVTHAFSNSEIRLDGFSLESLWNHSLEVSKAAKAVASYEGAEKKFLDEAFVAGLLHDVGKLVFALNLPQEYQAAINIAREMQIPLAAAEKQVFGANHGDVGGYLLGLWGLPVPVVEAIALHHRPELTLMRAFSPLTAVHVGNTLASVEFPSVTGIPASEPDLNYLSTLGLKGHLQTWRKAWQDRNTF
ncbi:MAG: response regulator [Verrucomicrobiota bacterium]|jgi:HD-like signal output (HDOD) protein